MQRAAYSPLQTACGGENNSEVEHRTQNDADDGHCPQIRQHLLGTGVHVHFAEVCGPDVLGVGGVAAALDTLSRQEGSHDSQRVQGAQTNDQRCDAGAEAELFMGPRYSAKGARMAKKMM